MAGLNDTHPEAEQVLREALRKMPFAAKLQQMNNLYRTGRFLHALGYRQRHPGATEEMVLDDWRSIVLGPDLVRKIKETRDGTGQGERDGCS